MRASLRVIGIDPGPIPGIVMLHYVDGRLGWANVIQCTWPVSLEILAALLAGGRDAWPTTIVQVERFVVGRGSGKAGKAGSITRDLVGHLEQIAGDHGAVVTQQNAGRVKHWASDARLKAVQVPRTSGQTLLDLTLGMRHARDAARHAVFAACHDGRLADPLSKTSRTRPNPTQGAGS